MTALTGPYATRAELKNWLKIPDSKTDRDAELDRRLLSASEDIIRWCHRPFGRDDTASTRTFYVGRSGVDIDDFWTTDDFAVVPYLGTMAGTAWDVDTLYLEPFNGIVDGVPGWPYNRISLGEHGTHPLWVNMFYQSSTVRITAKWGWAAVPTNINTACLMLASMDNKAEDAPFGVAGFGDYAVRIRSNPMAQEKLDSYVKHGTTANSYMAGS